MKWWQLDGLIWLPTKSNPHQIHFFLIEPEILGLSQALGFVLLVQFILKVSASVRFKRLNNGAGLYQTTLQVVRPTNFEKSPS